MERVSSSHSYGESGLHLQFTPKYRREVFRDTQIQDACRQQFIQIAKGRPCETRSKYGAWDIAFGQMGISTRHAVQ